MGFLLSIAVITAVVMLSSSSGVSVAVDNPPVATSVPTPAVAVPLANCGVDGGELGGLNGSAPTIVMPSGGVAAGETVSIPLVLNDAPSGLSGYLMEIAVDSPEAATITGIEYPEFGLTREMPATGSEIRFAAVDVMGIVQNGASNITIATINVQGLSEGATGFSVNIVQMDDDSGDAIVPEIVAGTLTIC